MIQNNRLVQAGQVSVLQGSTCPLCALRDLPFLELTAEELVLGLFVLLVGTGFGQREVT